jgi:hypothetical protein
VNLALFGGSDRRPLGLGSTKETFVASSGGGEADLSDSPPERQATLRDVAIFGGPGPEPGAA